MEIVLQGKSYGLTDQAVKRVAAEKPGPIQRYAVVVDGRRYPLKQVAAEGLGVPPVAFTSQQAYRWLTNLGFEVIDVQRGARA